MVRAKQSASQHVSILFHRLDRQSRPWSATPAFFSTLEAGCSSPHRFLRPQSAQSGTCTECSISRRSPFFQFIRPETMTTFSSSCQPNWTRRPAPCSVSTGPSTPLGTTSNCWGSKPSAASSRASASLCNAPQRQPAAGLRQTLIHAGLAYWPLRSIKSFQGDLHAAKPHTAPSRSEPPWQPPRSARKYRMGMDNIHLGHDV